MPAQALTTEFLATLPGREPASGAVSYFDTEIKGFLLEHRASGGATFYFRYRDAADKIRFNRIGRFGDISVQDARAKAHQMSKMLEEGGDPKVENHRLKDVPTFEDFVRERYLPYANARKRSAWMDESLLRIHILPKFAQFRMNRITRSDVVAFHHAVRDQGYAPGTCNRMLTLLKFIYNCAIRWDILPPKGNPCAGVEEFENNRACERYLTREEAGRLFQVLDEYRDPQVARVIKLLLYTGARKREVLDAKWEDIDWERRILTVPAVRSKSKKVHYIPLSDAALDLLRSVPHEPEVPWIFFHPKSKAPINSMFCAWNTVRTRAGIPELRLHDLRHSFASFLVNSGRSLYEVQKLLGHHDPKVTMRYAHLSPQAMIEAVNVVGNVVGSGVAANQNLAAVATA